jgi:hypothetical protein
MASPEACGLLREPKVIIQISSLTSGKIANSSKE